MLMAVSLCASVRRANQALIPRRIFAAPDHFGEAEQLRAQVEFLSLDRVDVHRKSHAIVFPEQLDAAAGFGKERRFANGKDRGVPDRCRAALDRRSTELADVEHMAGVDGTFSNAPSTRRSDVLPVIWLRADCSSAAATAGSPRTQMTSGAAGGSASAGHSVNFAKLNRNAARSEDAVAVWAVTGITAAIHTRNVECESGERPGATASSKAPEKTDARPHAARASGRC